MRSNQKARIPRKSEGLQQIRKRNHAKFAIYEVRSLARPEEDLLHDNRLSDLPEEEEPTLEQPDPEGEPDAPDLSHEEDGFVEPEEGGELPSYEDLDPRQKKGGAQSPAEVTVRRLHRPDGTIADYAFARTAALERIEDVLHRIGIKERRVALCRLALHLLSIDEAAVLAGKRLARTQVSLAVELKYSESQLSAYLRNATILLPGFDELLKIQNLFKAPPRMRESTISLTKKERTDGRIVQYLLTLLADRKSVTILTNQQIGSALVLSDQRVGDALEAVGMRTGPGKRSRDSRTDSRLFNAQFYEQKDSQRQLLCQVLFLV